MSRDELSQFQKSVGLLNNGARTPCYTTYSYRRQRPRMGRTLEPREVQGAELGALGHPQDTDAQQVSQSCFRDGGAAANVQFMDATQMIQPCVRDGCAAAHVKCVDATLVNHPCICDGGTALHPKRVNAA